MAAIHRAHIEGRMREGGLKVTPQRFAVLEFLAASHDHPTADEIFKAINHQFPRASRATVYNAVTALAEAGMIDVMCLDDGITRYDANLTPHHHFVCRQCYKIFDVPSDEVRGKLTMQTPHEVESYEVIIRGLCQHCQSKQAKRAK
ncbi:MAG: Fur family transcriptional regulator [Acidobacteriota bacterium]